MWGEPFATKVLQHVSIHESTADGVICDAWGASKVSGISAPILSVVIIIFEAVQTFPCSQ